MPRLLFEKMGRSVWISHLDLMRVFQRAFKRAGLPLTHTHGFNPRPSVSIALPLSVGIESKCELLDFDLEDSNVENAQIRDLLNGVLVEGIRVIDVYDDGRKIRDLSLMNSKIILGYNSSVTEAAVPMMQQLFEQESVVVIKKTKSGPQEQDIIPMIRNIHFTQADPEKIEVALLHCCQNPTLNPMQVVSAISKYLPEYTPDFTACQRIEICDQNGNIFR